MLPSSYPKDKPQWLKESMEQAEDENAAGAGGEQTANNAATDDLMKDDEDDVDSDVTMC